MSLPVAPPVDPSQVREKRPGRAEIVSFWVVFALMAIWTLGCVSLPLFPLGVGLILGMFWLGVGAWWMTLGIRLGGSRSLWVTVLVAPILVIGLLAFSLTDLPLQRRFELSRGAFDATAADLRAHPDDTPTPGLVGTYVIDHAEVENDIVVLYESTGRLIADGGFTHVPEGDPGQLGGSYEMLDWTDLGGGWYAFVASW